MRPRPTYHRSGTALLAGAVAALAALSVIHVAPAAAQTVPTRRTGFDRVDDQLAVSVGLPDLLGPEERRRLTSGFATTVLIRVFLYRGDDEQPVAAAFRRAEIVYDIWDEKFRVRTTDHNGRGTFDEAATADRAIQLATLLWRFPLVPLSALTPGVPLRVGVRGDLNPLSEELVADVRRRLVRPSSPRGGDSFFGSFVNIFINPRIEESEHQVRFLSQVIDWTRVSGAPSRIGAASGSRAER